MDTFTKGNAPRVHRARRELLERGEVLAGAVDEVVARSWRRSLGAGLTPLGRVADPYRLSDPELRHVLARQRELIDHARPVMDYLYSQVRDSHNTVILSNHQGLLMRVQGDADFLARAERVALMPGVSWHEGCRGTNAIGTTLAEGVPLEVHGGEHFLQRHAFLTCSAAPIFDPTGKLAGAIDISGDQRGRHPHTQGLVRTAAQMIENQMFIASYQHSTRLHFHSLAQGIGTIAEGIAAISEDGWIIGANRAGRVLLGLDSADIGATSLEGVFGVRLGALHDWDRRHPEQPLELALKGDRRLFVRVLVPRRPVTSPVMAQEPARDALTSLDTGDARLSAAIAKARRVLDKPIPLLLQGETGVGKELFARAVHESGSRRGKPFVAVNCAALPENLIEAELFGYQGGAFTGARREGSPGRLREADGGTLFLDEIGDMPLALQCRLLRVLEERSVTPLGGGKAMAVDFALLSASHRQLREEVAARRFRADLYYRLNGLTLMLPALRERSDMAVLVARTLGRLAPSRDLGLTSEVEQAFGAFSWPGNLRQLNNALRTAVALVDPGESWIDWAHLPDDLVDELRQLPAFAEKRPGDFVGKLDALACVAIEKALLTSSGNVSEAARRLGISRNTLYRKLTACSTH